MRKYDINGTVILFDNQLHNGTFYIKKDGYYKETGTNYADFDYVFRYLEVPPGKAPDKSDGVQIYKTNVDTPKGVYVFQATIIPTDIDNISSTAVVEWGQFDFEIEDEWHVKTFKGRTEEMTENLLIDCMFNLLFDAVKDAYDNDDEAQDDILRQLEWKLAEQTA